MTTKLRDDQSAEHERALTLGDLGLAVGDDTTPEQLEVILTRFREIIGRIDQQQLEPGDWAVVSAVLKESM